MRRDPREEKSVKMERINTEALKTGQHTRTFMEKNVFMKGLLKVVGVLGVSLVMSGMLRFVGQWLWLPGRR